MDLTRNQVVVAMTTAKLYYDCLTPSAQEKYKKRIKQDLSDFEYLAFIGMLEFDVSKIEGDDNE